VNFLHASKSGYEVPKIMIDALDFLLCLPAMAGLTERL
jgi:hypothetical protein